MLSVGFISLGCAKNLVDSQVMAGELLAEGLTLAAAPEVADVVVVNTCAFIDAAREESVAAILDACRLKDTGPCRAVLVAGCLPQRYRDDLRASLPEVDAFIGLDELDRVAGIARRAVAGGRGLLAVSAHAQRLYEPPPAGVVFSGGPYAYLKIAEGCNHACTFCAIPAIRGRHRSRSIDSVCREAEALLDRGFRELNVISQDVTAYGRDRDDGADLPGLLRALGRLGGHFRVRLLYGYPSGVNGALLAAMAQVPQVCHYLDVPVQHSHPDILRGMRRAHTVRDVARLPARARAVMPDVTLRTTCLVGFPGETDEHVRHLEAYVEAAAFDHLGVFVFSPEEGTPAERLPGRPARRVAERRRERLLAVQKAIVDERAAARIGTTAEVLLEAAQAAPGAWRGRAAFQAPEVDGETIVTGVPDGHHPGDFLPVRFTAAADYNMLARAGPQPR